MVSKIEFVRFLPKEASEQDFEELISLFQMRYKELNPQDSAPPSTKTRRSLEAVEDNAFWHTEIYLVRLSAERTIGQVQLSFPRPDSSIYEGRKHMALLSMYVLPKMRRQGIGRQMLRFATEIGIERNLTLFEGESDFDSGKAFARQFAAKVGLEDRVSRAYMKDIDWGMIQQWHDEGQQRNPDTRIIEFDDWHSEDETGIKKYCALLTSIYHDVPDGDLESTSAEMLPEQIRKEVEYEVKRGLISNFLLSEEADGRFTGLTKINYDPDSSHYVQQRITGVLNVERGRGLGKWLKAAMLLRIKEQYPNVEFVSTSNAGMNAPMLSINERIGFKLYTHREIFQLQIEDAKEHLGIT